jgi:hypothetical protein
VTAVSTRSEPHFVLMKGTVWVAPSPDHAEFSQCTGLTSRGKRCLRPLDHSQATSWSWLAVPGGRVEGYDFDGWEPQFVERYLDQRCELHFGNGTPAAVEPEWRRLDPVADAEHIVPLTPVDTWAALTDDQRTTVRVAAPTLAAALESSSAEH